MLEFLTARTQDLGIDAARPAAVTVELRKLVRPGQLKGAERFEGAAATVGQQHHDPLAQAREQRCVEGHEQAAGKAVSEVGQHRLGVTGVAHFGRQHHRQAPTGRQPLETTDQERRPGAGLATQAHARVGTAGQRPLAVRTLEALEPDVGGVADHRVHARQVVRRHREEVGVEQIVGWRYAPRHGFGVGVSVSLDSEHRRWVTAQFV